LVVMTIGIAFYYLLGFNKNVIGSNINELEND